MKIESIYDAAFASYGKVIEGYDMTRMLEALETYTPCPQDGTVYTASVPELEAQSVAYQFAVNFYGGMPIELGCRSGYNTKLNCLAYHRDSEVNFGTEDFILLLAKMDDLEGGRLDTAKVRAFLVPKGVPVEIYATTLHHVPCSSAAGKGFRVLVVLPFGTNGPVPSMTPVNAEDETLWACNQWLLAHAESEEAAQGAKVLLDGANIDIASDIA